LHLVGILFPHNNHTGTPQQRAFWMQFTQLIILSLHRKH